MKQSLLIISILFCSFFSSCDSIFRDAPNDTLSRETIWKDQISLDAYLLPLYRNMCNGFYAFLPTSALVKGAGKEFLPWYGDQITPARADWYNAAYGDILKSNSQEIIRRGLINWSNCYSQIYNVNLLLENESKMGPDVDKNRVLGEAYFFRAYYYYMLFREYGGVLLIANTYNPIVDNKKFPRASYDEMVDFIVADAERAAQYLPEKQIGLNLSRIEKGAAIMLKAKTYLWAAGPKFQNNELHYLGFQNDQTNAMLEKAKEAYEELIAMNHYVLTPIVSTDRDGIVREYRNIFLTKHGEESIFEVQHSNNGDFINEFGHKIDREAASPFFGGTTAGYCPTHNHVQEYRMLNGKKIEEAGSGYDPNKPYENRDHRFYANILYDGAFFREHIMEIHSRYENGKLVAGVDLTKYGSSTSAAVTNTGYYLAKFMNENQKIDTDPTYASSQNYMIWRYAEVLLDCAEIWFQLGDVQTALNQVNEIRRRVHVSELSSLTWEDIVNERRIELAFEESTYWDVLRWGIAFDKWNGSRNPLKGIKITKQENGSVTFEVTTVNRGDDRVRRFREIQYYMPIPWDEIRYQGIDQNPEWQEI